MQKLWPIKIDYEISGLNLESRCCMPGFNFIFLFLLKVRCEPISISQTGQKNYPTNRLKIFRYFKRRLEFEEALLIIITKHVDYSKHKLYSFD